MEIKWVTSYSDCFCKCLQMLSFLINQHFLTMPIRLGKEFLQITHIGLKSREGLTWRVEATGIKIFAILLAAGTACHILSMMFLTWILRHLGFLFYSGRWKFSDRCFVLTGVYFKVSIFEHCSQFIWPFSSFIWEFLDV